jgi:uncharacterized protein
MHSAEFWIKHLRLERHPEGGYFREIYRATDEIVADALPSRFPGSRSLCTSIYFLLTNKERSHLHRIKSDEIWYYHMGNPITLFIIENGDLSKISLGSDITNGEQLQVIVPAGSWFGGIVNAENGFCLCSCSVSPGFDFDDFELGERNVLLKEFPLFRKEIVMLTRN